MSDFIKLESDATDDDVDRLLQKMADLAAKIESIDRQTAKLVTRKAGFKAQIERQRSAVSNWMQANGKKTLRLPTATLSIKPSKAKLKILSEEDIPLEYFAEVVTTRLDRDKLKAALTVGQSVDGATLDNAPPILAIRF